MTQDDRKEVMDCINTNHRNHSKYNLEEGRLYAFVKHCRK